MEELINSIGGQWYFPLLILLMVVSIGVSGSVNRRFKKYSKYRASSGMTGAQAAQRILNANGIYDVEIVEIGGHLSDNYNPLRKTLNLSSDVYRGCSISSVAVAAHECGHAIQHARHYFPLMLRKTIVPIANISSSLSYILIIAGLFMQAANLITIGAVLFSAIVVFNFITLPVETNASRRALAQVEELGILGGEELRGGKKVLTAAAMTYFIALVSSLLQLLRLLSIANRRN